MEYIDFRIIITWIIIALFIILLSKISKKFVWDKKKGSVVQSRSILLNMESSKVFDVCMALVRQDAKLVLHYQDRDHGELVINKKFELSRAPARIAIKVKHISAEKSEVEIVSRPRYYMNGVVTIDFGQNLENVEYISGFLLEENEKLWGHNT